MPERESPAAEEQLTPAERVDQIAKRIRQDMMAAKAAERLVLSVAEAAKLETLIKFIESHPNQSEARSLCRDIEALFIRLRQGIPDETQPFPREKLFHGFSETLDAIHSNYEQFLDKPADHLLDDKESLGKEIQGAREVAESLGTIIRALRNELGMYQEDIAREIAVTTSTVNRWENTQAIPSNMALLALIELAEKRNASGNIRNALVKFLEK